MPTRPTRSRRRRRAGPLWRERIELAALLLILAPIVHCAIRPPES